MSRFINYQPMHVDEINYNKCKWLINEVCTNGDLNMLQTIHIQLADVKIKNNVKILKKRTENKTEYCIFPSFLV